MVNLLGVLGKSGRHSPGQLLAKRLHKDQPMGVFALVLPDSLLRGHRNGWHDQTFPVPTVTGGRRYDSFYVPCRPVSDRRSLF